MSNRAAHAVQSIGHLGDDDLEYSGVIDALELANRVRAQDVLIDTLKSGK
jgi:ribonuclease HI